MKYTNLSVIRSSCGYGAYPANKMVYATAHKKGAPVNGMCGLGSENFPALDYKAKPANVLKRGPASASGTPTAPGDWPMYRGNPSRRIATVHRPVAGGGRRSRGACRASLENVRRLGLVVQSREVLGAQPAHAVDWCALLVGGGVDHLVRRVGPVSAR